MFSKSKTPGADIQGRTQISPPSVISRGLTITGDLKTDGEIHVDGRVLGDVSCGKLVVGAGAAIEGEITAREVDVHGDVTGCIRGDRVQLAKTAKVLGDIWHESLSMEAGAHLEGQVRKAESKVPGADSAPRRLVSADKLNASEPRSVLGKAAMTAADGEKAAAG